MQRCRHLTQAGDPGCVFTMSGIEPRAMPSLRHSSIDHQESKNRNIILG